MTAVQQAGAAAGTSAARRVVALLALTLAAFAYVVSENLPVGLLPQMSADLGVGRGAIGLLITGHAFAVAVSAVPITRAVRGARRRPLVLVLLAVFTVASALAALARNYPMLLAARVLTATTHAAFWSIVGVVAVALFAPDVRGRVLSVVFAGVSLAPVVGVPAITWFGERQGWQAGFWAVTAAAAGCVAVLAVALPGPAVDAGPGAPEDQVGAAPDRTAYRALILITLLGVTGTFTAYSYFAPLLTDLGGADAGQVSGGLLLFGLAGTAGILVAGRYVDRRPRAAMVAGPLGVGAALAAIAAAGGVAAVLVACIAVWGAGMAMLPSVLQTRVLTVAPGDTAVASSVYVAAFNGGIGTGALLGALLLDHGGLRVVAATGAVLALVATGLAVRRAA